MEKLKHSNLFEINQLKRRMSSDRDEVVTELNAQIRQLTLEREEALAQVSKQLCYDVVSLCYITGDKSSSFTL